MRVLRSAPYQFKFKFHEGYLWVKSPKGGVIKVQEDLEIKTGSNLKQKLFMLKAMSKNEMFQKFKDLEAVIDVTIEEINFFNQNKIES